MAALDRRPSDGSVLSSADQENSPAFRSIIRQSYENWRKYEVSRPLTRYTAQLRHQAEKQAEAYWTSLLRDYEPLKFAPPQGKAGNRSEGHSFDVLDPHLLYQSCAKAGLTTPTLVQAAWAITLSAVTSRKDVCFAYAPPSRDSPVEGPFLSTLYRRVQINEAQKSRDFFRDLQASYFEALSQQGCTDAVVENSLQLKSSDFANTLLAISYPVANSAASNTDSELNYMPEKDVVAKVCLSKQRLSVDLRFNAAKVGESAISQISILFKNTLSALTAPLSTTVGQLSKVSYEGEKTVSAWNKQVPPFAAPPKEPAELVADVPPVAFKKDDPVEAKVTPAEGNVADPLVDDDSHVSPTASAEDYETMKRFNGPYPKLVESCIHDVISRQAMETPYSQAICSYDGNMTYAELEAESSKLACYLRGFGVKTDVPVSLCLDKSKLCIVTMIAVLKAGGVNVNFASSQPPKRIETLVKSLDSHVALVSPPHRHLFDSHVKDVIVIDEALLARLPAVDESSASFNVQPTDPCFIVYTSGSTGLPKGIKLEHQAIVSSSNAHGKKLGINHRSRVLQFSSFLFDVFIQDIFTTLQRGGTVCMLSEEERMDDLAGAIRRTSANFADLTSTVASMLNPEDVPTLATISLGGESMRPEVAAMWQTRPGMKVLNTYGPAECAVTCVVSTMEQREGNTSVIGTPTGCWCWVVDPKNRNRLCPIGEEGELLVEGPILAREYVHEPKKTAAAFIKDLEWSITPGSSKSRKFYATGDLVRLLPNGTYLYVGRIDRQTKINGQRIELEEIESNLTDVVNGAGDAVVEMVALSEHTDKKSLVAFVASDKHAQQPSACGTGIVILNNESIDRLSQYRALLIERLPRIMVPGFYFPLKKLPVNPSGKLDRRALSTMVQSLSIDDIQEYSLSSTVDRKVTRTEEMTEVPAEKAIEEVVVKEVAAEEQPPVLSTPAVPRELVSKKDLSLRDAWCEILEMSKERVNGDSNFFTLGGDSVSAMRLVSLARKRGLQFTVAQIFKNPVLGSLATVAIEKAAVKEAKPASFALCPRDTLSSILKEAQEQCSVTESQIKDLYPCTKLQEGLVSLTERVSDAYIERSVFKLEKDVDMDKFRASWDKVHNAYNILRTRFMYSSAAASYFQVVLDNELSWTEGTSLSEYISRDKELSFGMGKKLSNFALIEEGGQSYFVLTLHHALYDGWSYHQIFEDVQNAYKGKPFAHDSDMRPVISYLASQSVEEQAGFWQKQLGDEQPTSWPHPPLSKQKASVLSTVKRSVQTSDIQRDGITDSNLVRAAWALTVSQYSGSEDILMATTLSGRDIPVASAAEVAAPLITTVPLRVKIDLNQSIDGFFTQLQDQATDMISFQHYGLQNIKSKQKQLGSDLDLQHLFVVQPKAMLQATKTALASLGLEKREDLSEDHEDTYPLNVEVSLDDWNTTLKAVYDTSVIEMPLMERIMNQFVHLTTVLACSSGDMKIKDLDVVNSKDLSWMVELNQNVPARMEECVHHRFEQQVLIRPHAEAISSFDGDYTYKTLNQTADLLARKLRALGVGPGTVVPLCFDKSSWAIVSIFAVLKAGGAYTNLSASYPEDRLRLIIEDVKATVVLASPQHVPIFTNIHAPDQELVTLGVESSLIEECKQIPQPPPSPVTPRDAAYLIYTSGSTGRPKGVVVEHASMVTSGAHHGAAFGHGPSSRVVQFASYLFDVSVQDILTSLMRGACVCVVSEEERISDLAGAMNRLGVNMADLTPTVASFISPEDVPGLKMLTLGGEILTEQVLQTWLTHGARLLNTYGPTECAINSTYAPIDSINFSVANIGVPLGCVLWVVRADNHNKLVPVGCIGEMLIEGPIEARGYLNDTAKTDAAFVQNLAWLPPDPVSQSRRMYKSGDLVRYREDGGIEYCGRKDQQVKINGLRIELGEIESQILASISGVQSSAVDVVSIKSRGGAKVLAAFVRLENAGASTTEFLQGMTDELLEKFVSVKEHLEKTLPKYMVPSLYFPVSELPSNASGKLDRKRLKALVADLTNEELIGYGLSKRSTKSTSSSMEVRLQELWAEVLSVGKDEIAADANFFNIGGDSNTAMRLATLARSRLIDLTIGKIFQYPRLCDLAQHATLKDQADDAEVIYQPFSLSSGGQNDVMIIAQKLNVGKEFIEDILPATPLQEGMISITSRQPDAYMVQLVYRVPGSVDIQKFKQAWTTLISQLPVLRTRLVLSDDGSTLQVVVSQEIEWKTSYSLSRYLKEDSETAMDYGTPLLRLSLVNDAESGDFVFVFTAHHAIYDGWSMGLLFERLEQIYYEREVPEVVHFSQFIQHLQATDDKAKQDYWRRELNGAPAVAWPVVPQGHSVLAKGLVTKEAPWSAPTNGQYAKATFLRAAWAIAVGVLNDTQDVLFAENLSGRNISMSGAQDVVAPLLSTVPTRIHFTSDMTKSQLLLRIQEQGADIIEFQHTGLQNIREFLDEDSRLPELNHGFIVQPRQGLDESEGALGLQSTTMDTGDFNTFAVNLTCNLEDNGVFLEIAFDTEVQSELQIKRLASVFELMLNELTNAEDDTIIGDLNVLGAQDKFWLQTVSRQVPSWVSRESSKGTRVWIVDEERYERLLPQGCIGEVLLETTSSLEGVKSRQPIDVPSWRKGMDIEVKKSATFILTGQLAYFDSDGDLELLGNTETQYRINGQRFDSKPVHDCIMQDSGVKDAVVIVPESGPFTNKLIAGVTLAELDSKSTVLELVPGDLKSPDDLKTLIQRLRQSVCDKISTTSEPTALIPLTGEVSKETLSTFVKSLDASTVGLVKKLQEDNSQIATGNRIEQLVQESASKVLHMPLAKTYLQSSFAALGGDSIAAMRLVSQCRAVGVAVTVPTILKAKSLKEIAANSTVKEKGATSNLVADLQRPIKVSPIQHWYFDNMYDSTQTLDAHYNQSFFGKFKRAVEPKIILDAIEQLAQLHPMLRAKFTLTPDGWTQVVADRPEDVYEIRYLKVPDLEAVSDRVSTQQTSTGPIDGLMFSANIYEVSSGEIYISMVAHHLVVDIVSWNIILDDIQALLSDGPKPEPEPVDFLTWTRLQAERGNTAALLPEATGADAKAVTQPEFWGIKDPSKLTARTQKSETIQIDSNTTSKLLGPANSALHTEPVDLLVAAVCHAFLKAFPEREDIVITNEGHGREPWADDIDLTRTVGWFTILYPVRISRADGDDYIQVLRQVKDNRRKLVQHGWAYFASRYLNPKGQEAFGSHDKLSEIVLNYHGQTQQLHDDDDDALIEEAGFGDYTTAGEIGQDVPADSIFDLGATISEGMAEITFEYQEEAKHQERIMDWMHFIGESLSAMCASLCSSTRQMYTLSDLPLVQTNYRGLDRLSNELMPKMGITSSKEIEDVFPCTPLQDGILISQIRDPGSYKTESIYEVSSNDFKHPVSADVLEIAWELLIERHAALRTVFFEAISNVTAFDQLILKNYKPKVTFMKAGSIDAALESFKKMPEIDYQELAPPHRLSVCEIPNGNLVCRFELSHTIIDGASSGILLGDLQDAYQNVSIAKLPSIYRDFVGHIYSVPMETKLDFWRDYLSGLKPTVLPSQVKASKPGQGGELLLNLDSETQRAVQTYCRSRGATAANLVQTAWAIVLAEYTGSRDVCFGYLAAGRDAPVDDIDLAIGAFVNMLVCRVHVDQTMSGHYVVHQVQEASNKALEFQHTSLTDLQHNLGLAGKTLFNTIMSFQRVGADDGGDDAGPTTGLTFNDLAGKDPTEYDITIDAASDGENIQLCLGYSSSMLDETSAAKIMSTMETAIKALVQNGPEPLGESSLLTNTEIGNTGLFMQREKSIREEAAKNATVVGAKPVDVTAIASSDKPTTPEEAALLPLWSSILSIRPEVIGINDSFLGLGGDSFMAMRLAKLARNEGLELNVSNILKFPKLSEMAATIIVEQPSGSLMTTDVKYKPFALMKGVTDINAFIRDQVLATCSYAGNDNVEDMHPVTSAQASSIRGMLSETRNLLTYFMWTSDGVMDVDRLTKATQAMTTTFSTLRSAYIDYKDGFLQVVLKRHDIEIQRYETRDDIYEYLEELQKSDMDHPPRLGDPPTRFALINHGDAENPKTAFVMRMCHAQYDGDTANAIKDCFFRVYEGSSPVDDSEEPALSQAEFNFELDKRITEASTNYWRSLLRNSKMPNLVDSTENADKPASTITGSRWFTDDVAMEDFQSKIFTSADITRAAWARTLAGLGGTGVEKDGDSIFAVTVSGRNLFPGAERVMGLCSNWIPVRLQAPASKPGRQLLQEAKDQSLASMPHDYVGLDRIAHAGLPWTQRDRPFTSLLVHQSRVSDKDKEREVVAAKDEGAETAADPFKIRLGELDVEEDVHAMGIDPVDIVVQTYYEESGLSGKGRVIEVSLETDSAKISDDFGDILLESLCKNIADLLADAAADA